MALNEILPTTLYSSKGSLWNTLFSKILGLPLLELVAICTNLVVLVLFLLREFFFCVGGRVWFIKDNDNNVVVVVGNGETFDVRIGTWFKLSVFSCLYVLLVQVLVLGFDGFALIKEENFVVVDLSLLSLPVVQCLVWIVLSFTALRCKYKGSQKFPILLRVSWFVVFVVCLCGLYVDGRGFWVEGSKHMHSHVLANFAATPALAFLCIVAIRGVSGIQVCRNAENQQPLLLDEDDDEEPGCLKVTPYSDAGLFSLATLSWLNSILSIGAKRPLELKDIPLVAPKDRAKTNFKILNSNWEKLKAEKSPTQPSLAWTLLKSFWKEAAINAIFAGVTTLVSYVGPYMISYFVDYLSGIETFPHEGYVLAGIFFVAKLVETFTTRQWYLGVDIMGMHVRSALTAMVYQKGLRLSSLARQSHTSGEIVNYMAIDVQRVGDYAWYLHDMWMLPLQIVLALAILYKNVGIAAVATLVATIISIVITIPVARIQEDYQDKLMAAKDERMRKTSECLRNMRILKLQAWEDRYRIKLEEMRGVEFKWLKKALYSQAFITFMFWSSPIFVSAVTFATSILLGGTLTAGGVLSALATFRILQEPLRNFPDLVSTMAQTKVSLDRLSCFLLEEELQEDATTVLPQGVSNIAIEIKDSEFSWDPSSSRPTLSEINMKVEKGMRVAVCGTVGSGKSSFLSCILGEIPKLSGEVSVCGSAAYVSQSAWIQSGTIEENILFGSPKDKPKYKNVIHACSLKKDLELFSHGDQTIIGDRGINLSGGQKQRVQLARALYQDADIYLLDDPFSAVDAHTGSELFREYILTALANKTVIFVTHQVEFLPAADLILVLREGCIIQAGKYDDLLQAGTDFKALVSAHHEAIEAMDIPSHSSEDSDENLSLEASVMTSKKSICSANDIDSLTKEMQDGPSASDPKANKEKKKAKRSRKKQLVQEEERVRGRVSMKVYLSYMAAAYKGLLIPLIIIAQALFQFLQIASNWWMAWANPQTEGDQPKVKPMILLLVYMALAFGSSLFIFVRAVLVATFGLAAAQKLFLKMLRCVFSAPMYFFDSTPAGRILNRVSVDQSVVDLDIPFRLGGFAATTIQLIGIVGVMTEVTWQVLLLVIPMAIACLWMQKYYMASSRELVRIVSIQKSPIINLFGESIAGASTIRGFGQEKRFMKRNLYLLDCFARPFFCSLAAIEWLCLRMELLSTFVFAFCMVLLVSFPRGSIDPSMAGLAVTYGLNLNARLSRWILSFCKLENKIISIERIYQYSQIKRRSQVPDKEQLVQILNRIPLPADLTAKLLDVGNNLNAKNDNVQMQTSPSYHHRDDQLNNAPPAPLTKDFLAVLSTTPSTPARNGGNGSTSSADHMREKSSGSSQSPNDDSDCQEDVRVKLPLQLFGSSPENDSPSKLPSSRKYFSSESSNPVDERTPSSSPPVVEMNFGLQGGIRGFNSNGISTGFGGNANKETSQSHSCTTIPLDLFKGSKSNNMIQQSSSVQSVPFKAGYASSGSDYSPPSLNSDTQDRTGRIMFKLFDKHPSHFPGTLRTQIYNWLSTRPSDLESYIRPGCVVLSIYASMSSAAWVQLEENFLQRVDSLIHNSDSDFWRNGRFLVYSGSQLASHKDGRIRMCKPWGTWRSPELISVSPLAIVGGQETSISLKGRNLSAPGTKIHCTGADCYTSSEVIGSGDPGMVYDEIKLSGFEVQNTSPSVLGRCFIEVENGFKGNSFPVIIANASICKELRPLESEFDEEEKMCDAISEEHEHHFGRPKSRDEALHFLNELGWLFQRERFSNVHEVPDYSLDRFKFVLTFSVERNCCMLVKTLLDLLVDKYFEGEGLSTGSAEMLKAIQLLNRAVKRKCTSMVDLLINYSITSKNDTSKKYVFPPNLEGPGGITPLHLAASTTDSEGVIDSLTNDPQEIGLKCWETLADENGQTPHAYAMMRNNHSYNMLVARKRSDRQRSEVSVRIDNEIEHPSLGIELMQKRINQVKRVGDSCSKCAIAEVRAKRRFSGSRSWLHGPFIHSMLAVAAVCVCVCVLFRGTPYVGSVSPFRWENLNYGTM